jgi:ribosomal protein L4
MTMRKAFTLLLGLAGLAACGQRATAPPPELAAWQKYSATLDSSLYRLRSVEGSRRTDEAATTFTGWFDGDELRVLVANNDMRDYGATSARYYYDADHVAYVREHGLRRMQAAAGDSTRLHEVESQATFNAQGTVVAGRTSTDGITAPVDVLTARGLLVSGTALRDSALAIRARGGRK